VRTFTLAVAVCATLAVTAAPAAAAKPTCSRKATATAGSVVDLTRSTQAADGTWQLPQDSVQRLDDISIYGATSALTVAYAGVTYRFQAGAIFALDCAGARPAIELGTGTVTATGAVSAPEGRWAPAASRRMTMRVTRTPKGEPTLDRILANGPDVLELGTVTVATTAGRGYLDVTPTVGAQAGTRRRARGGTFTSTAVHGKRITGTATFVGLAPSA